MGGIRVWKNGTVKILALVTDAFGGRGGIAKFNRDFLTALCDLPGCEGVSAIPRFATYPSEPLPDKLSFITTGTNSKVKFVRAIVQTLRKKEQNNLIICGHINLLPTAYFASLITGAPLILVVHGIDAWGPARSFIARYLVRKIDAFISVSELTRNRFLKWSGIEKSRGFILPNSIELGHFGPGPKDPTLLDRYGLRNKTVMMTMGRLASTERYKGFDEVMELLPALSRERPDICYVIAGEGDDRRRLEEKAKRLGIAERVVFTGEVSSAEKADYFRLADVFVMPSSGEGFGIVFLEAMACGVSVVASRIDGGREAVRDGKLGLLVDPSDKEEVKWAILKAIERPRGVVPEGLEYFSFENFRRRLHEIIDQVMKGRENA